MKKGQGAIEYLLIIGAAIIVVAVAIIAIGGMLSEAKSDSNAQDEYYNSYMNMKSEHIGYSISINPGEHDSFSLSIKPNDSTIKSVFSNAPTGTEVRVNYGETYTKNTNGWGTGDEVELNQGDIIDVSVPSDATSPLLLSVKGAYSKPTPKTVSFDCSGRDSESYYISSLTFTPAEKDIRTVFKDFFDNPKAGSYLSISEANRSFSYYGMANCIGTPCESLNETQCNDTYGACNWNSSETKCNLGYPESGQDCSWYENPWDPNQCTMMGCQLGEDYKVWEDLFYNYGSPEITIGSSININCVQGQEVHAKIVENLSSSIESIDSLDLSNSNDIKPFMLKNYSCYTFDKLRQKILDSLNTSGDYYYYLSCTRGNDSTYQYNYFYPSWNWIWEYYSGGNMSIYQNTVCSAYAEPLKSNSISLTC